MCLANNRYGRERVAFRATVLVGLRVKNPQSHRIEHVLVYKNRPDVSDFNPGLQPPRRPGPMPRRRGNAMLISLPVKKGSKIGLENLIPVKDFEHFVDDYQAAVAPPVAKGLMRKGRGPLLGADSGPIVVKGFDGGLYDVVIAHNAAEIPSVIEQVDDAKRPQLNTELYRELDVAHDYEMVHFLFCFAEEDAGKAGCVAIRYTPANPKKIFLPALDGHNGYIERGDVTLNHTLVLGSYKMRDGVGKKVYFRDFEDVGIGLRSARRVERPYWMLDRVVGAVLPENMIVPQGDFEFDVADVERGVVEGVRRTPKGWSNLPDKPKHPATVYIRN